MSRIVDTEFGKITLSSVFEDKNCIKVIIFDGEMLWKGFVNADSRPISKKDQNILHYLELVYGALQGDGSIKHDTCFIRKPNNSLDLTIKEYLEGTTTKILLLKLELEPSHNSKDEVIRLLTTISEENQRQLKLIRETNAKEKELLKHISSLQNELQIAADYKDKYQDELIFKFSILLNSKKRKIYELETKLQQHTDKINMNEVDEGDVSDHSLISKNKSSKSSIIKSEKLKAATTTSSKQRSSKRIKDTKEHAKCDENDDNDNNDDALLVPVLPPPSSQLSQILIPTHTEIDSKDIEGLISSQSHSHRQKKKRTDDDEDEIRTKTETEQQGGEEEEGDDDAIDHSVILSTSYRKKRKQPEVLPAATIAKTSRSTTRLKKNTTTTTTTLLTDHGIDVDNLEDKQTTADESILSSSDNSKNNNMKSTISSHIGQVNSSSTSSSSSKIHSSALHSIFDSDSSDDEMNKYI